LLPEQSGRGVEDALDDLSTGTANPRRHRELLAVRFYLHDLIEKTEAAWTSQHPTENNLHSLIDEIDEERNRNEPVCFVTFNYDTLLERALRRTARVAPKTVEPATKVDGSHSLFKLHGSTEWGRITDIPRDMQKGNRVALDHAGTLRLGDTFYRYDGYEAAPVAWTLVPAIAVPLAKKAEFECPASHVAELKTLLPQTSRAVIVGWRAGEAHFRRILFEHMPSCPWLVIAEHRRAAQETIAALGFTVGTFEPCDGGFTHALARRVVRDFLRRTSS
jgi:hypothetical protein